MYLIADGIPCREGFRGSLLGALDSVCVVAACGNVDVCVLDECHTHDSYLTDVSVDSGSICIGPGNAFCTGAGDCSRCFNSERARSRFVLYS